MTLKLPTLPPQQPTWPQFQLWWQQVVDQVNANEAGQADIIEQQANQIDALGNAQLRLAIGNSFTIPTMILTAADVGVNVTITIAAHVRRYPDGAEMSITGGTITGLPFSTAHAVYYDDAARENSAPSFFAVTDLETAQANYAEGRHYLGTLTTPANGAGNTTGGAPPPGSGYTAGASAFVLT